MLNKYKISLKAYNNKLNCLNKNNKSLNQIYIQLTNSYQKSFKINRKQKLNKLKKLVIMKFKKIIAIIINMSKIRKSISNNMNKVIKKNNNLTMMFKLYNMKTNIMKVKLLMEFDMVTESKKL